MNVIVRWTLTVLIVAGLAVDAYTHLDLANLYRFNKTDTVSEETLFRIEAVLAILVAIAVLVRRNVWTALAAVLVAGGGLALLIVYRYVDVGTIGPLPNMYEPLWFAEKNWAAVGEAVATVAGLALLLAARPAARRRRTSV